MPAERGSGGKKEMLFQLASGSAETGDLPRAVDLGHELANLDFGFRTSASCSTSGTRGSRKPDDH